MKIKGPGGKRQDKWKTELSIRNKLIQLIKTKYIFYNAEEKGELGHDDTKSEIQVLKERAGFTAKPGCSTKLSTRMHRESKKSILLTL